jgi:hypothetical protein
MEHPCFELIPVQSNRNEHSFHCIGAGPFRRTDATPDQVWGRLAVNPSVPVNSIRELTDYARANLGRMNFSSAGTGGATHIAMAAFELQGCKRRATSAFGATMALTRTRARYFGPGSSILLHWEVETCLLFHSRID